MLIEIAAVFEMLLFTWAWTRRKRAQRWHVFMGNGDSIHLPIVDDYLSRCTAGANRVEVFVASQLAGVCRKAVQTHSFQSLLLYGIRSARNRRHLASTWRISQ